MAVYYVLEKPETGERAAVKDGPLWFSILGLFFTPLVLLFKKESRIMGAVWALLWAIYLIASWTSSTVQGMLHYNAILIFINIGFAILLTFAGNKYYKKYLTQRGYTVIDTVVADNAKDALVQFGRKSPSPA